MNIADLREALAEDIRVALPRTTAYVPDQVNPPSAFIEGADVAFDDDFDGHFTARFGVVILTSAADPRSGQLELDKLFDDIRGAVTGTLGGDAHSAHVEGVEGYGGNFDVAGTTYIGARMIVEVYA